LNCLRCADCEKYEYLEDTNLTSQNSSAPASAATTETLRRVLGGTHFYEAWPDQLIDALCEAGQPVRMGKGESRLFNSQTPPMVYLIESGVVEIVVVLANGRDQAFGYLHEGAFIGLHHSLALVPPDETHEYVADSDVAAWRFLPDKFKALMHEHFHLADTVIGILASRLSFMVDAVACSSLLSAEARVARCLLKSQRDAERKVLWATSSSGEFNISQAQLARMLGLSRQSVGTTLREFEQRGLIATRRQKIDLLNPAALREIVNGVAVSSGK
jgi:CRP-like cAMP-binding protein